MSVVVLGELLGLVLLQHVAQRVRERGDDRARDGDRQLADRDLDCEQLRHVAPGEVENGASCHTTGGNGAA